MKTIIVSLSGFSIITGILIGYNMGTRNANIRDFKEYQAALYMFSLKAKDPQFKEFLKARYYYFSNRIPTSYVVGPDFDFGDVNSTVLNGMPLGKGPTTPDVEYKEFRERMAPYQKRVAPQ